MRLGDNANVSLVTLHRVSTHESVQALKQTGYNDGGGNYKFFTQIDLSVVSRLAQEQDCVLIFSSTVDVIDSGYRKVTQRNGSEYDRLTTHCTCRGVLRLQFVNDKDDYVEVDCYGHKVDQTSDKALGASTIAKRYGIMQMFDIATIEGDPDGPDDIRKQDAKAFDPPSNTARKGLLSKKKTLGKKL